MGFLFVPLIGIILNGFALYAMIHFVDSISYTGGIWFFIIGGIIMGLINFLIKPIIRLLSLPFMLLTGGLFMAIINVFLLWGFSYFLEIIDFYNVSLTFESVWSYFIGALVFGIVNYTVHLLFKK